MKKEKCKYENPLVFKWIYIYIHCDHILRASSQTYSCIVGFFSFVIIKEVYMLIKKF